MHLHGGCVQRALQSDAARVPTACMFAEENSCTRCRWLGWDSNMQAAVALYAKLIRGAEGAGPGLVRGLATDIANYTPRECSAVDKLMPSSTLSPSGQPVVCVSSCAYWGINQPTSAAPAPAATIAPCHFTTYTTAAAFTRAIAHRIGSHTGPEITRHANQNVTNISS